MNLYNNIIPWKLVRSCTMPIIFAIKPQFNIFPYITMKRSLLQIIFPMAVLSYIEVGYWTSNGKSLEKCWQPHGCHVFLWLRCAIMGWSDNIRSQMPWSKIGRETMAVVYSFWVVVVVLRVRWELEPRRCPQTVKTLRDASSINSRPTLEERELWD